MISEFEQGLQYAQSAAAKECFRMNAAPADQIPLQAIVWTLASKG